MYIHRYTCIYIILGPFWDHCFCTIWGPCGSFWMKIGRVDAENRGATFWKGPGAPRAQKNIKIKNTVHKTTQTKTKKLKNG